MIPAASPFHPDNGSACRARRERKLAGYPARADESGSALAAAT